MIDFVISVVSGGAAGAHFEAAQLMLAENTHMLTEHSKFSNCNVLAAYAACGNQPGCGDHRRGGRNGGGSCDGGADMINGEWDKRGIANGDHDFAVHKLNNIDKCWYPDPEYQKMNHLEKRRLYLNKKKQKKSSDWSGHKAPTSVNAVSITNSQLSKMYTPISSLETYVKNQDNCLK